MQLILFFTVIGSAYCCLPGLGGSSGGSGACCGGPPSGGCSSPCGGAAPAPAPCSGPAPAPNCGSLMGSSGSAGPFPGYAPSGPAYPGGGGSYASPPMAPPPPPPAPPPPPPAPIVQQPQAIPFFGQPVGNQGPVGGNSYQGGSVASNGFSGNSGFGGQGGGYQAGPVGAVSGPVGAVSGPVGAVSGPVGAVSGPNGFGQGAGYQSGPGGFIGGVNTFGANAGNGYQTGGVNTANNQGQQYQTGPVPDPAPVVVVPTVVETIEDNTGGATYQALPQPIGGEQTIVTDQITETGSSSLTQVQPAAITGGEYDQTSAGTQTLTVKTTVPKEEVLTGGYDFEVKENKKETKVATIEEKPTESGAYGEYDASSLTIASVDVPSSSVATVIKTTTTESPGGFESGYGSVETTTIALLGYGNNEADLEEEGEFYYDDEIPLNEERPEVPPVSLNGVDNTVVPSDKEDDGFEYESAEYDYFPEESEKKEDASVDSAGSYGGKAAGIAQLEQKAIISSALLDSILHKQSRTA